LCPQDAVGVAMVLLHIMRRPKRGKIVHYQQRVLGGKGNPLEGVARARPASRKIPGGKARAEVLFGERRNCGLEDASRSGEVVGEVCWPKPRRAAFTYRLHRQGGGQRGGQH
jgi:hypothetical protein